MNTKHTAIQAVFWDIDGTLILSEALHYQVLVDLCTDQGVTLDDADYRALLGITMDAKWAYLRKRHAYPLDRAPWRAAFNEEYGRRLMPQMRRARQVAAVRALKDRGVPQACVSNADREVALLNLGVLELTDCFSFVVADGDFEQGKPAPDPYLAACSRMGLDPSVCMAVEDSVVGVTAALAAGFYTVAWPEHTAGWDGPAPHMLLNGEGFPWEVLAK